MRRDLARLDKIRRRVLCAYCAHGIARVVDVQRRHLIMPLAMTKVAGCWRTRRLQRPVRPGLRVRDRDGRVIAHNAPPGDAAGRVEWCLPADVKCPHCGWTQRLDATTLDVVSGQDSKDVLLMRDGGPDCRCPACVDPKALVVVTGTPATSSSACCACRHGLAAHVTGVLKGNELRAGRCLAGGCLCFKFREDPDAVPVTNTAESRAAANHFSFWRDVTRPGPGPRLDSRPTGDPD
ncbi:MAG: hypothetical protein EPO22_04040 [Dehalococcoidia bacterium]|nr:MAG: hypothetical protein EPO22_04040 [Dehalococcoidia bacterium]